MTLLYCVCLSVDREHAVRAGESLCQHGLACKQADLFSCQNGIVCTIGLQGGQVRYTDAVAEHQMTDCGLLDITCIIFINFLVTCPAFNSESSAAERTF